VFSAAHGTPQEQCCHKVTQCYQIVPPRAPQYAAYPTAYLPAGALQVLHPKPETEVCPRGQGRQSDTWVRFVVAV
jgi:hypothetical protein